MTAPLRHWLPISKNVLRGRRRRLETLENLANELAILTETLGIIEKTTGSFGAMKAQRITPDGIIREQVFQFHMFESQFQNLVEGLGIIDSVFYHDVYGVVDYAGCQFFYISGK